MKEDNWKHLMENIERSKKLNLGPLKIEPRPDNWDELTETQQMLDRQFAFIKAADERSSRVKFDDDGYIVLVDKN